jgi:hypothetical protein
MVAAKDQSVAFAAKRAGLHSIITVLTAIAVKLTRNAGAGLRSIFDRDGRTLSVLVEY